MIAWVLCLLVGGVAWAGWHARRATDTTKVDPVVMPADLELRSGDIILAGGVSLQSRMVRSLTDDNTYSHVGLIEVTPHGVFVIHTAPAGPGDGGVGDQVSRIPLALFLAERGYVAVRVMRLHGEHVASNRIAEDACAIGNEYVERAVPFDPAFDLSEHDSLYCSELVYLVYHQAGLDWPGTLRSEPAIAMVSGPVILPGAFADCAGLQTIWQHPPKGTIP